MGMRQFRQFSWSGVTQVSVLIRRLDGREGRPVCFARCVVLLWEVWEIKIFKDAWVDFWRVLSGRFGRSGNKNIFILRPIKRRSSRKERITVFPFRMSGVEFWRVAVLRDFRCILYTLMWDCDVREKARDFTHIKWGMNCCKYVRECIIWRDEEYVGESTVLLLFFTRVMLRGF